MNEDVSTGDGLPDATERSQATVTDAVDGPSKLDDSKPFSPAAAHVPHEVAAAELTAALESDDSPEVQVAWIQAAAERYKADVQREIEALRIERDHLLANLDAETQRAVAAETSVARVQADAQRDVAETSLRTEGVKGVFVVVAAVVSAALGVLGGYAASSDPTARAEPATPVDARDAPVESSVGVGSVTEAKAKSEPAPDGASGSESRSDQQLGDDDSIFDESLSPLHKCLQELASLEEVSRHPAQTVDQIRLGISGVRAVCRPLETE